MKTLRKIVTVFMIMVVSTAIMAGCGETQNSSSASTSGKPAAVSTGTSENTPSGNSSASTDSSGNSSASTDSSGKIIKEGTIQKDGNVILKELAFVYNGKTIGISDIADDEKLENILGKAEGNKTHTYSKDDGLNMDPLIGFTEKQYKFKGLDIKTINATEDKKFFIFQIKITDSKYPTARNIKVGDSAEKLKEAYPEGKFIGNGAAGEEDDFQYLPANYVDAMKFHVKNKKVESIMMYKLLD